MVYLKAVKKVNPTSSHYKETKLIVIIISHYMLSQIIKLYALNLYSGVGPLYLNQTERKKECK